MFRFAFREKARLQKGILLSAPVFWASFSVFLNPICGFAGFLVHFSLCLPRKKTGCLPGLLAYPLFCLWFGARHPSLTLKEIPFHRDTQSEEGLHFRTGTVVNFPTPNANGGTSFSTRTSEGLFRASLRKGEPPLPGQTVLMLAKKEIPEAPMNPGERDARSILRAQGALAYLRVDNWRELKPPSLWRRALTKLRTRLQESLREYVPAPTRALVEATLLNNTEDVSEEAQQDFAATGMQHILAISGQHIALLAAFLLFPALCLRLPRKAAFALAAAVAAVYIPVTGSPVSVARAGFMLACFLPSVFLERPASALNIFCLTVALDLILSPFHILNLGFQLSYAATLALILCTQPSQAVAKHFRFSIPGAAAQMVFLSGVVCLFTYPVLAASTHAFAPWGLLGNLITVPVSSAMLIAGLCTWAFTPFPFLAHAAGSCAGFCSLLLEGSVHLLAKLPGALWPIAQPSPFWVAWLMSAGLTVAILFRTKNFKLGFLITAILISLEIFRPLLSAPKSGTAEIHILSVSHGDASVLQLPGAALMIDAGPSPRTAQKVLIPFLQSRGIRHLDVLMLTHPDLDHYGGAFALLQRVSVGFILAPPLPPLPPEDAAWDCLRREALARGIPWKEGRAGDLVYEKGVVSFRILGPDSSLDSAADNDHSLVGLLQTAREKALFTGDIEGPSQQALARTWPLWRGSWLKAPHHGSDRTTLPCFLTAAKPPRVAISSGHRPGFPGRNTVEQLKQLQAQISVTARDGAICWNLGREIRPGF